MEAGEDRLEGRTDLAERAAHAGSLDRGGEQIAAAERRRSQGVKGRRNRVVVAGGLEGRKAGELLALDLVLVHDQNLDVVFLLDCEEVDADDLVAAAVDGGLLGGGGFFDAEFGKALVDGLGHAPLLGDLGHEGLGGCDHLGREVFEDVAARPGVDGGRVAGLGLEEQLRVARDARRHVGGQGDGLVERVGVQGLGAAHRGGQGFDGRARDVVPRVLGGQRPARGLGVGAEHLAFCVGTERPLHAVGPQHAPCAHLGNLLKVRHAVGPKEAQPRRKRIHVEARLHPCLDVLEAVGQCVRQLNLLRRTRLLHVVAADADRVEARHVLGGVRENVADDPHGRRRRIDERVAHHELLEDVVLDGARQLVLRHALLLCCRNVEGQNRQHRPIHRHADAHLVERDAFKKAFHVFDAVNGHAGLAHVSFHAFMVAVVPPVRRKVKCHAQALLASREVAAVKRVALLGRREARVLTNGPWPHRVHRRVRSAEVRRHARPKVFVRVRLAPRVDVFAKLLGPRSALDRLARRFQARCPSSVHTFINSAPARHPPMASISSWRAQACSAI